jgi:hypothetical protein
MVVLVGLYVVWVAQLCTTSVLAVFAVHGKIAGCSKDFGTMKEKKQIRWYLFFALQIPPRTKKRESWIPLVFSINLGSSVLDNKG